jgi:hypothetical protein
LVVAKKHKIGPLDVVFLKNQSQNNFVIQAREGMDLKTRR